jgi:acetolactate synthase I/II/III large subunit
VRETQSAADELVALLADEGVRHLFFNPGTDTAPVQEALASARERGAPHPTTVLCTHEQVALSAALGHWLVSRQPQALMVHVDAGTLNLGGALHQAQRNQVPVVVMAGRTPYSVRADVPGHRDNYIHWQQEQADQAAAMRAYGKWTMEVPRGRELGAVLRRAFQVARSSPPGVAYVMLPREALMEPGAGDARCLVAPRPPAPDPEGLAALARRLAEARRPVIVTARAGRSQDSVPVLARIAELVGAPVLDHRDYVNLPPHHPLGAGTEGQDLLREADAVLVVDSEVPWIPSQVSPPADAAVLQIDLDCVKASMPLWTYPVTLALQADSALALPMLEAELRALGDDDAELARRWAERRRQAEAAVGEIHRGWRSRATSGRVADAPDAMLAALDAALPADAIVLEEAVTNRQTCVRQLHRPAGRYFQAGAPALGWGLGAAMGVRLAAGDAPVVTVCGDGSFHFGVPTAALWSARRAGAPFTAVVLDNGTYVASRRPVEQLFPEGAARRADDYPETRLGPSIDYVALAAACGAEGLAVTTPAEMGPAVNAALAANAAGRCAVVVARLPVP